MIEHDQTYYAELKAYQELAWWATHYLAIIAHGAESVYFLLKKKGYVLEELHQIHFGDLPEGAVYITSNGMFKKGESNGDYESADTAVARDR